MSETSLALAPWQARILARTRETLDAQRLGHALLFCGPALLGKRADRKSVV